MALLQHSYMKPCSARNSGVIAGLSRPANRSTYLAMMSTSRFTGSPNRFPPSVVFCRVKVTSATLKEVASRWIIVRLTPSTAINPFFTR